MGKHKERFMYPNYRVNREDIKSLRRTGQSAGSGALVDQCVFPRKWNFWEDIKSQTDEIQRSISNSTGGVQTSNIQLKG